MEKRNIIFLKYSLIISLILSVITYRFSQFGFPFQWITYHGENELYSVFSLLKIENIIKTHFDISVLAVNITIIYFVLFYGNKILKNKQEH